MDGFIKTSVIAVETTTIQRPFFFPPRGEIRPYYHSLFFFYISTATKTKEKKRGVIVPEVSVSIRCTRKGF